MANELLLTALDCARRTGLTIRALRLYESHGLITPHRTEKGWRLYGREDIERLNEVVALKALGMGLREIATLLKNSKVSLDCTLEIQERVLQARREQADEALRSIHFLRSRLHAGQGTSLHELLDLVKGARVATTELEANIWRAYGQARPRREIALEPDRMLGLTGTWAFDDGTVVQTELRGEELYYLYPGQPGYRLSPEATDQFFLNGVSVQVTFSRSAADAVVALHHHQGGIIDVARPVPKSRALEQSKKLAEKVAAQRPCPESESLLRRLIDEQARNSPDYSRLTLQLAQLVAEQQGHLHSLFKSLGNLRSLCFRSVSQSGSDVYEAQFEHGTLECGIALTPSGLVGSLHIQPI
ncbi:MerR family transcriptional regulator [Pseudomonas nitroreducens]|uniref:MerR family transcriptional regulator n=1 Tax=Pseudomonas nitroreducens TaxID=46680 RepID=UPI002FDFFC8E